MTSEENTISEGRAKISTCGNIFYNPVQEFNRDISITALTVFAEQFKVPTRTRSVKRHHSESNASSEVIDRQSDDGIVVLEALAATGLRSIRYALEVPNVKRIYANDCSPRAVEAMKRNIEENNVQNIVSVVNHDAIWLMQKLNFENEAIHAIDLDPYGCPTRFLDSAVNCISDGGLLMITCTDMAVIAGNTPETCFVKYGSISLRSSACHEMALRIALSSVSSCCGKYGKYIVPLLSISADFYIRIFVRVDSSQRICKETSSNISMVYQCNGCEMMTLHPLGVKTPTINDNFKFTLPTGPPVSDCCVYCGHKFRIGGPIWNAPLHDPAFVEAMLLKTEKSNLNTSKRIYGMLSLIREELPNVPLYYTIDSLCSKIHCQMIPLVVFRSALRNAGFEVSLSHCKSNSIKTNAPHVFIWDVLRQWVKKHPVSEKRLQEHSVTASILKVEPQIEVDFTICKEAIPSSISSGLLRYQQNPSANWGPGTRSKSNVLNDGGSNKRMKNQNKKSRLKMEAESMGKFVNSLNESTIVECGSSESK